MHKAGLNVLYTAWWLKTMVARELKEFGLTHEQFNVMRILKGSHPQEMCIRDISCRMIERSSNVPRIMDRLVAKNLVKRATSVADKRETVVSLTPAGIQLLDSANQEVSKVFEDKLSLDPVEAKELNSLLERLRESE